MKCINVFKSKTTTGGEYISRLYRDGDRAAEHTLFHIEGCTYSGTLRLAWWDTCEGQVEIEVNTNFNHVEGKDYKYIDEMWEKHMGGKVHPSAR